MSPQFLAIVRSRGVLPGWRRVGYSTKFSRVLECASLDAATAQVQTLIGSATLLSVSSLESPEEKDARVIAEDHELAERLKADDEPIPIAELDAFDLRTEIAHGLHASDGLRVEVIDENTLMVIGTDSTRTRGLYLATGRLLQVTRDSKGEPWWIDRYEGHPLRGSGAHVPGAMAGFDDDLAWVRRRSEP